MNVAGILLMIIWGSFLVFSIGAWIFIMLGRQESELMLKNECCGEDCCEHQLEHDTFEQGDIL